MTDEFGTWRKEVLSAPIHVKQYATLHNIGCVLN